MIIGNSNTAKHNDDILKIDTIDDIYISITKIDTKLQELQKLEKLQVTKKLQAIKKLQESRKLHNLNSQEVSKKLREINQEYSTSPVLPILFHSDLQFINPLFLSLLLIVHEKYIIDNIVLIIDVLDFNLYQGDSRQHYIFRLLLSFINTPHFSLVFQSDEIENSKLDIISRDSKYTYVPHSEPYVDKETGTSYKKLIFFYHNKHHKDTIFLKDDEHRHLLPILKTTNYPNFIYSNILYNDSKDKFDVRKKLYQSITINNTEDMSNFKETFENKFLNIVKPTKFDSSLMQPLKDVFFEMVDNIKRHTQYPDETYADSYFNFYYDKKFDLFEFTLIDNFNVGFINTYIKTLEKDKEHLEQEGLAGEEFYKYATDKLNDPVNDIDFLKAFFSEEGWFEGSKIARIIFHFGIPLLIKIIKDLDGEVNIRLHRSGKDNIEDKFYNIVITKDDTKVYDLVDVWEIKGTYISIKIPNKPYKAMNLIPVIPTDEDYIQIVNDEKDIVKIIKTFKTEAKKTGIRSYAIYDFDKVGHHTISDFIRFIYVDTNKHQVKDALIINIPLNEYVTYLQILSFMLYVSSPEVCRLNYVNFLFRAKTSFDVVFIGGKNLQEYCASNNVLFNHYGQENLISNKLCNYSLDKVADSIFFYKKYNKKNDFIILPFELLTDDKLSTERTIIEYLQKNKRKLHFDTQRNYHVDIFYPFNDIFQYSSFFSRIAYRVAEKIQNDNTIDLKKVSFIGYGKYLNLFLALLLQRLNIFDNRYITINDLSKEEHKLKAFVENDTKINKIIIFSSVAFSGEKIGTLIEHIVSYDILEENCLWYNLIRIKLEDENIPLSTYENFLNIEIPKGKYHKLKKSFCSICSDPIKELPLFSIDDDDEFKIEKTYFGNYDSKMITKNIDIDDIRWYQSVKFGHIKRNANHYSFYTKSINFFNEEKNNEKMKLFLEKYIVEDTKEHIILTPMHSTHNKFIAMVNKIIFNGTAKIFQLDKSKGIKNFYDIKKMIDASKIVKYDFYYVDDEISSGYTFEYYYSILRYLKVSGFKKAFIMIDRTNSVDEEIIKNYLFESDLSNLHCFTKLEIKPIKTEIEDCFLCEKRDYYVDILKNTVLDMNRFAIARKIIKLNAIDYYKVDFELSSKNFNIDDFRNYLKMYAVDYAYTNFTKLNFSDEYIKEDNKKEILKIYHKFQDSFIKKIVIKIEGLSLEKKNNFKNEILKIAYYEGSIALLKALSFPKLAYYEKIRYMTTVVLIYKIQKYIEKDAISYFFENSNIASFKTFQSGVYKKFIEHFENKRNMNYLNFLYITASYLNINYVIDKQNIEYYFVAAKKIKDDPKINDSLYKDYQLATKIVGSYSEDKARFLQDNITKVKNNNDDNDNNAIIGYKNLLGAIELENHNEPDIIEFQEYTTSLIQNNNKNFPKLLEDITEFLNVKIPNKSIKIESVFINENTNLKYDDYGIYLKELNLIDSFNNYILPNEKNKAMLERLVKGALTVNPNESFRYPEDKEDIDNTWVNINLDTYSINDENKKVLIVKLVDINTDALTKATNEKDNHPIWYKPLGCIVMSYDNCQEKDIIQASKYILSIQNKLVEFIKSEFSHGAIQEAIQNNEYEDIFRSFNHEVAPLFEIQHIINRIEKTKLPQKNILLKKFKDYVIFANHLTKIGRIKKYGDNIRQPNPTELISFFNLHLIQINNFFELYINNIRNKDNQNNKVISITLDYSMLSKNFIIPLKITSLKIIFYELFFNVFKYGSGENRIIKLESLENNTLRIANTISGDCSMHGNQIALKNIQYLLNKIQYDIKTSYENNEFIVVIKEKT